MTDVFFTQVRRTLPVEELSDVYYPTDLDRFTESVPHIIFANDQEATIEVNVPRSQAERFLQEVLGIKRMVLDMAGGRVAHLALHHRKDKVRKKNLRRAIRMLEKEK